MKEIKLLLGDSLIYGIGGIFIRATQIFILPLILFYLKKDEFGVLDYFLNIKHILVILFGWGILTSIFKYSENIGGKDKSPFNGLLVIFTISAISFLLVFFLSYYVEFIHIYWENIISVYLIATFGSLLTIPLAVFRHKRKPVNYIILNLVYTLLLLGSSYYLVITTNLNYKSVLYGHVFASFISFMIGFLSIKKFIDFRFDTLLYKRMFNFGFSVLLNSLSFVILLATTRFFLKAAGSFEDVGILGMSQRISLFVGAILISPFSLAWLPFVKSKSDNQKFYAITNKVFTLFLWVGLLFTFTLELLQNDIFKLTDNVEYLPSTKYVMLFSLSYLLQGIYFIFSAGIFLSGNTKQYKIIGFSAIIFNLILYLIGFNYLSILVVAFITFLSFFLVAGLAFYFGNENVKINVLKKGNLFILSIYLLLLPLAFYINSMDIDLSVNILLPIKLIVIVLLFSFHVFYERKYNSI